MRKFTVLFCTKARMFLSEVPVIFMLCLAIFLNDKADSLVKLYPLIVVLSLFAIFIFIYFFRLIIITEEGVRTVGVFSSRDSAILNEGKTLILTKKTHGRLSVAVFGNDGTPPALDWAQNEEHELFDIFLYRERAIGGNGAIRRVLTYFGVSKEEADDALSLDVYEKEFEAFNLSAEKKEDIREIKIKFTKTL